MNHVRVRWNKKRHANDAMLTAASVAFFLMVTVIAVYAELTMNAPSDGGSLRVASATVASESRENLKVTSAGTKQATSDARTKSK